MCDAGSCVACDVCASGCSFSSIQAAIDAAVTGATIRICLGAYGQVNVNKNLTLIGAGDGDNPTSNTILNGSQSGTTLQFNGVVAAAQRMRITGGRGNAGGGVLNAASATLTNCTITGNTSTNNGGGVYNAGGTIKFVGCTITQNNATSSGGGIYTNGVVTLDDTDVTSNTAASGGGVYNGSGPVTLQNGSTVSGNTPNNCVGVISGAGCAA
jgi:predicted outer membrane repeat protein